jgi:hypothetical protein
MHMTKLKEKHLWIDSLDKRESCVYFELVGNVASLFPNIMFIASRDYGAGGLVIVTIYFQGVIYVTLEDCAESGDQPLFDINFPQISDSGRGATLAVYDGDGNGHSGPWMKLSVWQSRSGPKHEPKVQSQSSAKSLARDLSSDCYLQSYVMLKSDSQDETRQVLFRFGSWLYTGQVKLVPKIAISDVPYVMPAVRLQQRKLDLLGDIDSLSVCSPFGPALEYSMKIQSLMEGQAAGSEDCIRNLLEHGQKWLAEEDDSESFFEFACFDDGNLALHNVEMIATKTYSSGVIIVSIYYGGNWYLALSDGDDFPLVDTKFPPIVRAGASGFNIQYYPNGMSGWPQLRSFTLWRSHREGDNTPTDENDIVSRKLVSVSSAGYGAVHNFAETERDNGIRSGDVAWDTKGMPVLPAKTMGPQGKCNHLSEPTTFCPGEQGESVAADEWSSSLPDDICKQLDQLEISRLEESLDNASSVTACEGDCDIKEEPRQNDMLNATCLTANSWAYESDIYAQLDMLEKNLDKEIESLKEWGD